MMNENPETPKPEILPPEPPNQDERTMAMLAHVLGIFSIIGPLFIWLIKKDESPFVNDQAKEAMNFQILVLIIDLAAGILTMGMGCIFLPAIFIANLVFCIMAGAKANEGVLYRYPFNLRLIK